MVVVVGVGGVDRRLSVSTLKEVGGVNERLVGVRESGMNEGVVGMRACVYERK